MITTDRKKIYREGGDLWYLENHDGYLMNLLDGKIAMTTNEYSARSWITELAADNFLNEHLEQLHEFSIQKISW